MTPPRKRELPKDFGEGPSKAKAPKVSSTKLTRSATAVPDQPHINPEKSTSAAPALETPVVDPKTAGSTSAPSESATDTEKKSTVGTHPDKFLDVDALEVQLSAAMRSYETAEVALLYLMKTFSFDLEVLKAKAEERGLKISFSRVTFKQVAPLVGLDPVAKLGDCQIFNIHRARIPENEFKSIIEEVDRAASQYGHPLVHENEEARSRYLATLFNRTISWFQHMLVNTPESTIEGRLTNKGKIEYQFRVFGSCTVVFVEMKLQMGNPNERLNCIAQVIAEADACEFENRKLGFHMPVYGVLCDGNRFEFFRFDSSSKLARGFLPFSTGYDGKPLSQLALPTLHHDGPREYIAALKPVCEVFYWLFLTGYNIGLDAFLKRSEDKGNFAMEHRGSTKEWESALALAVAARELAEKAGQEGSKGDVEQAEQLAEEARSRLDESIKFIPSTYQQRIDIMAGYDEKYVLLA